MHTSGNGVRERVRPPPLAATPAHDCARDRVDRVPLRGPALHRGRSMPTGATPHKRVAFSLPPHSVYRPARLKYRIGIDLGRTLTDLVRDAADRIRLAKHPTTPA